MSNLNQDTLNFNNNVTMDFDGGNLSTDTGLLLIRYFDKAIGYTELIEDYFQTVLTSSQKKQLVQV